ncbi:rCG62137 [Rattus norvegicus]|uniref:RCG62137 n=1 Tax=Rattus norvegicus TaxID=10116 RepID=A6HBT6_RAT|nr:rCG62137 [Rattus norvegicus]
MLFLEPKHLPCVYKWILHASSLPAQPVATAE